MTTGKISGILYDDNNVDGIFEQAQDTLLSGKTVKLLDSNGNEIANTQTDEDGFYSFDNLAAGDYRVQFPNSPSIFFSPRDRGDEESIDSDVNVNGRTDTISIDNGEEVTGVNAGCYKLSSLGDFVFEDTNGNGVQDEGEPGIEGVTVRLQNPNGEEVATTTTNGDGIYQFNQLVPGEYKVTFVQPDGFDGFTTQDAGNNDAVDSDANPSNGMTDVFTLPNGTNLDTIDAGLVKEEPPEPATLGDRVFFDENRNGIQDQGEEGVPDAIVRLQDADGNTLESDLTDNNGNYLFDNLDPGDYKVTFVQPNGFAGFTSQNAGDNDAVDSDADPVSGMSQVVTLNPGDDNRTVDAGVVTEVPKASLGDFVFEDTNENGIQDEGEPGIEGARVILQNPGGETLAETTTNGNGIYSFDDLDPGQYKVTFVQPEGFNSVSPFLAGGNRANDSDANPNNGLMSQVVTLGEGEINNTIDAGFFDDTPDVTPGVDIEKLVRVEPNSPDPGGFGGDLCDDLGKPIGLTFRYVGGDAVNQTGQKDGKASASGASVFDDTVTISAGGKKGKGGGLFNQEVALGETFTITSSGGKGKFGSTTDISLAGDSGIQSLEYHTSCSAPIQLGDRIGGLELVGYQGEEGSTSIPVSNPTDNVDADNAPGVEAIVGDNIVFTYIVNNTGDTALDIDVTDDRLSPSFVDGDANGNSLLDTDEEWIYTASETASQGLQTNIGTVVGTPVESNGDIIGIPDVTDFDPANYTASAPPTPPPVSGDLCDTLGKPQSLTFLYVPSNEVNTAQEKFEFSGNADDDNTAFITAGGKKGAGFSSEVNSGETFTLTGSGGKGFGSSTEINIFDEINSGSSLQQIDYHTSCSDVIQLGDQIGSVILVGYTGEDGSSNLSQEQIDTFI